jgi:hypothetical protein
LSYGARVDEIDALVEKGDAARLAELAASGDKALAKRARRGLHVLRTRGISVEEKPRAFQLRAGEETAPPSMASLVDGRGERVVWYVRDADDGYDVWQAELSEARGLIGFQGATAPKKSWRERMKDMRAQPGIAEIPSRHARHLIERAWQVSQAAGRSPPAGFAEARLRMGADEPEAEHPALALAPPISVEEARARLAGLHALPEIAMWIPPEDALKELDIEVGQIVTSQLVVDPAQRRQQLAAAVEKIAARAFVPEMRARFADRLRETALLLASRGAVDDARLCNTAAQLTLDERVAPSENPFIVRMFEKLLKEPPK